MLVPLSCLLKMNTAFQSRGGRATMTGCRHTGLAQVRSLCRRPRLQCRVMALGGIEGVIGGIGKMLGMRGAPRPTAFGGSAAEEVLAAGSEQKPEFPPYAVIARKPTYDLRLYNVYPVVEMEYSRREEAYAALGAYIDGANSEDQRFGYTQPVTMTYEPSGAKRMQMMIGTRKGSSDGGDSSVGNSKATATTVAATLPTPKDPSVTVGIAGGELIAVLRFEGFITPTSVEPVRKALIAAVEKDGIKLSEEAAAGEFRVGQYGAVYQLGPRLNEMMIKVSA